eukprot:14474358-Alexandrium_andersonii.AAC.1
MSASLVGSEMCIRDRGKARHDKSRQGNTRQDKARQGKTRQDTARQGKTCLLYTSDAADDM